jgi:hypothetical protein
MVDSTPEQILAWLRDETAEARVAAFAKIHSSTIDIEAFWSEFPRLLRDPSAEVRWQAAMLLGTKGRSKDIGVFVSHLESLFDDDARLVPAMKLNTVGGAARTTVADYYVHHRKHAAWRALIARGGVCADSAVDALVYASEPDLIVPLLPDLAQLQAAPDEKLRERAATALAQYELLTQPERLGELLLSDNEAMRLHVLSKLDGLAEDEEDLGSFLPGLLSLMQRRDPSFEKTRNAAAKVLVWLILAQDNRTVDEVYETGDYGFQIADSFTLNGVDIMQFPEVKAEIEELQRSVQSHSWE